MLKTLKISFSLKNTYRVNSILYSLRQIPLIRRLLPQSLYSVYGLKIFANLLSILWETISIFLWKFFYLLVMVVSIGSLYRGLPAQQIYLHILLLLTVIGALINTQLFSSTRDKYYAIILMRMNAREFILINYFYSIIKVIIGFLPFSIFFGRSSNLSLILCLLIPFSISGIKLAVSALVLWDYDKSRFTGTENKLQKYSLIAAVLLLAAAYGLPAAGIAIPMEVSAALLIASLPAGAAGMYKILNYQRYQDFSKDLLADLFDKIDIAKQTAKTQTQRSISTDREIASSKKGFEYLNDLFIKRHRKILWKSSKWLALIALLVLLTVISACFFVQSFRTRTNTYLMSFLPYGVFLMYAINRGGDFTRALFMNCDRSLLTYSFYKKPEMVLKLFRIRLREIVKINLLPAFVIGAGLTGLLFVSGGTSQPLNYAVLFVSILCMSVFFSVHNLTAYYLLQPYNAETEIKSGTYQAVMTITYLICIGFAQVRLPILAFGLSCILFCLIYSAAAGLLIYKLAPRTFRLRS